jgi:hypothetical protein
MQDNMNKRDQAIALAHREANRERRAMMVLNLNPYSPLYVAREYSEKAKDVIAVVEPQAEFGRGTTELVAKS